MSDADAMDRIAAAVRDLDPQPRQRRWVSLAFCILDAVYSIGARYDTVVVPLVHRVATDFDITKPSVGQATGDAPDPLPLGKFLGRYPDEAGLVRATNKQRTSTRGGILKADAALRYARILHDHDVRTLQEGRELLADPVRLDTVETALRRVPGEGAAGVRRGYLWMLIGDEDTIKPDRMVLRWLATHGVDTTPAQARTLLSGVADRVSSELGRRVTAWEIDHAVWTAARSPK
ncbi:hypothetical protein QM806_33675 [Rhodococcus sp. IEGM 1351]|uniref:hypothetical protein n=1 Tax=Rhodococcus sp. IEGM 1351 TaxID=3047089 RepID=UPI0024B85721|nr:hypothetical protein [Rhodococcus sp. IEGM 1351]MDI9940326.1 hypothetical protein [Rhodococcus sp. IEGM 1351]